MSTDPATRPARPAGLARSGWSLHARVTALVIAVATLVALIGGVLSIRFVRASLEEQARERLTSSLTSLADRDDDLLSDDTVAELAHSDVLWAIVPAAGTVRGPAARYVDAHTARALRAGDPVSDTARIWRAPVVLEGVPVGGGGLVLATTEEQINTASRQLARRIVIGLAVGAVVATVAGAWFASGISRPLSRTASAADRIASGERSVPVPATTIPELSAMTDAIRALDRSLAASEGRQREFLLSISHELRTPLTAIRGYAEGLADGTFHGDAAVRAGEVLEAETARLHRFVDDLLELARLEADDFTLDIHPTLPAELLRSTQDVWHATAAQHDVTIDLRLDPAAADLRVEVDARRLRQIIDGLVENALRIAPAGSTLTLGLTAGTNPAITVRDAGPGLTDQDLARAFDRGILAERYRGSRPVGSGLGLSIAHRLAARLHITLGASRPALGPGTTMTIHLPPPVGASG
jgi:two-component system OmpR family sensor kinase